jgi:malonyl-CoA O-methyltransferase
MAERLPIIKLQPEVVLDWSGPLGASAALLQAAYPKARQLAVAPDAAPQTPTRRAWWDLRRSPAARQEFVAEPAVAPGQAQLLWSNMLLHGCADPPVLIERWQQALAVGGFLMFSTLGPGTLSGLNALYRARGWGSALAPFVDMHDLGDMLVQAGFADPVMDQEQLTLSWPDGDALLRELRGLGGNLSPLRHAGLRTPRWRQQLITALGEGAVDARPSLSFELVYGHAFRAAPRVPVQPHSSVSLQDMRSMIKAPRS